MKLTPGVNLANVLGAAFTCKDPESAKKIDYLTEFFAFLGSANAIAAHRTLMKMSPGVDFSNMFKHSFLHAKIPKV